MDLEIAELTRTKRKSLGIEIRPDGGIKLRAPMRMSMREIKELVEKNRTWIVKKRRELRNNPYLNLEKQYVDGEEFLYQGNFYPLKIVDNAPRSFIFDSNNFIIPARVADKAKDLFVKWYKDQAEEYITERVEWYTSNFNLRYQKIKITSAARRWGSCNADGNINFSWRLILVPMRVIDYVVVHELAHLQEMNHSSRFWDEVEKMLPDYREARKWLQKHQAGIDAI